MFKEQHIVFARPNVRETRGNQAKENENKKVREKPR